MAKTQPGGSTGKSKGQASSRPAGKPAARSTGKGGGGAKRRTPPPPVITGRPKPWGLIAGAVAVVVFAAAVIGYAVSKNVAAGSKSPDKLAAAAAKIPGIVVKDFPGGQHDDNPIKYDTLPPFGGTHNSHWADCSGTVYTKPIRDENAVHALEHGAVWITYRPDLSSSDVKKLAKLVEGQDHTLMSPYPGLKKAVSLQSWGHQLFVDSASDKRIKQFVDDLRQNPQTTPEYGTSCADPNFKANPAAPDQPAATGGSTGATPSPNPSAGASSSPGTKP